MPGTREKSHVADVDLSHVRNRNEQRVAKCLGELIKSKGLDGITPDIIKDVYALALNNLPARYTQQGTIVLREPVRTEMIEQVVSDSLLHVLKNPKKRPAP